MNTATMKCWSITSNQDGFTAPELVVFRLQGEVYGDSAARFPDGSYVHSSRMMEVTDCGTYKIVRTHSTEYRVYPDDVDPEYEKQFPGAYARLEVQKGA